MEFRILGPLEVQHRGVTLSMAGLREQRLLAMLLLSANHVVTLGRLVDAVWPDDPPASAKRQVQNRLSAVRQRLHAMGAPARILVADGPGYRIRVEGDQLDAHRFQALLDGAKPGGHEATGLRLALALWRGPALAGLTGRLIEAGAARLDEQRLTTYERYFDAELALGRHERLVGELTELVATYPLRERLVGQLMLALHRSARQADALRVFHELRRRLVDELGLDPSPHLQQVHATVLRGPSPGPASARVDRVTPAQLPPPVPTFVGRTVHMRRLDALYAAGGSMLAVISGPAGIGKTALAVHWAHRAVDHFPDGQLYVDLRGFEPTGAVVEPAEAIRGFLEALGTPAQQVPTGPAAQVALYRSLLAGKRLLVVLDNARSTEQIRPLLPGGPDCRTVVTSRNHLPGLVAAEGADPLTLDLLAPAEARQLLTRRVGQDRVTAEPRATDTLIALCTGLPLALTIVAARVATHPHLPLAALTDELQTYDGSLDAFTSGEMTADLRAVFSWSYRTLTPAAARLFRLFGLHPGPDISTAAAASLAGLPFVRVRPLLAVLVGANLTVEHLPGRYTSHDLLRVYATELVHTTDAEPDRRAALHRLLDHYLHTAYAADRLINPHRTPVPLPPAVAPEQLTGYRQALAWLSRERAVLLAAVKRAHRHGLDAHAWRLAWTLSTVLDRRGHWHDWLAAQRTARAAADRLADPTAMAMTHHEVARAYAQLGRYRQALTNLQRARAIFQQTANDICLAGTHGLLALVHDHLGRTTTALDHHQMALDLYERAGHLAGKARTLNNIGWLHAQLGDYQQALTHCGQAVALHQRIGQLNGQAAAWDSLGYAHHHLGHYRRATTCYLRALHLWKDLANCYDQAMTLTHLADTHHAARNPDAARDAWQQALIILDDINHPDAAHARARLNHEPTPGPTRQPSEPPR